MKTLSLKPLFRLFRASIYYKNVSNRQLKNYVLRCLSKKHLFAILESEKIKTIIEWYRYPNLPSLISEFKSGKLDSTKGTILYINSIAGKIDLRKIKYFIKTIKRYENIANILLLKYKNNKFSIKELKFRR